MTDQPNGQPAKQYPCIYHEAQVIEQGDVSLAAVCCQLIHEHSGQIVAITPDPQAKPTGPRTFIVFYRTPNSSYVPAPILKPTWLDDSTPGTPPDSRT